MEEEEAKKMTALKRAYADIILNTAKEAASRILVLERKALRFQQVLYSAKEEALNMLLRLKQIMDSKIAEAEKASLCQRKRIQELEAQLNEAEETVVDLRVELRRIQEELESMKNNPVKSMDEQIVKSSTIYPDPCQEMKNCNFESVVYHLVSGPELVLTSNDMDTPLNQKSGDDRCLFMFENATTQTEPLHDMPSEHYYAGSTDLASTIMRSKETELYRNGCTQKILAFEQNLLAGILPLHGQNDGGYSHAKNESMVGDDGTRKHICTVTSPKAKNMSKTKETEQHDSTCGKGAVVRFFRRSSKKHREKCDHVETTANGAITDQLAEAQVPSDVVPSSEIIPCSNDTMTESDENPSKVIEEECQKEDSNSHFAPIFTKDCKIVEDRKDYPNLLSENVGPTSHFSIGSVQNDAEKGDLMLTTFEQKILHTSDVSICKNNLETVDVSSLNSDSKDGKPFGTVGAPKEAVNDRVLKYTFRRKRKRVPLGNHNVDSSVEKKSTLKRKPGEKQGALPESQKSTLVMESSRDSRRLVQVARQLISLSEKRWR